MTQSTAPIPVPTPEIILPTLTIVETSTNNFVLLAAGITIRHPNQVGVVSYHTTLPAALFSAEVFLYHENDPKNYNDPRTYPLAFEPRPPLPHTNINLSDRAYAYLKDRMLRSGYRGTASWQGLGSFLIGLFSANPTWQDWQDTRANFPDDFDEPIATLDKQRAARNQFPIWGLYYEGKPQHGKRRITRLARPFSREKLARLSPLVLPIATHYCIAPYTGADILHPPSQISATIEAVGLQYLTPRNPPIPPAQATKHDRRGHRKSLVGGIVF